MASCEEADTMKICGLKRLDRDKDGIPELSANDDLLLCGRCKFDKMKAL